MIMSRISVKILVGAASIALPLASSCVRAEGSWLFGDWGGERTRLQAEGFDFQFGYTSETAYNAQGGSDHGTRYTDQWTIGSTLDLAKLFGIPDAKFQLTVTDRNG